MMVLGVIVIGALLVHDLFLHDRAKFDHLAQSGIVYVAGIFTTQITKLIDHDE
ncbi:MAG TPA: hypothetical protein VLE99_04510 [Candidatus Saccharimonadales bacterium]|nr:hypothetical protein [Candidatus Saccharimonadales bacterium]